MKLRRGTAVLTGTAALLLGGIPTAQADDTDAPPLPDALYGEADPTYDGVWRQSATLLALDAAGQEPPAEAVDWLLAQQCDDGSFTAFLADPDAGCGAEAPSDTNATALAVQALESAGDAATEGDAAAAVADGTDWLTGVQNDDGGWPYMAGDATDANSTALVTGALHAVGTDPAEVVSADGASGHDALAALQLPCEGDDDAQAGAFAWQPDAESGELFANEAATVDAALAVRGSGLLVPPADGDGTPAMPSCAELTDEADEATVADAATAHLVGLLEANDQHVPNSLAEGAPDFGLTSRAVLALAAGGFQELATGPLTWLTENHADWEGHATDPAALAQLVLAAHAAGGDPTDFGGTDLVAALTALGPGGEAADSDEPGTGYRPADDDTDTGWLLWILGVGLLAGVGAGVLLSARRRGAAASPAGSGAAAADPAGGEKADPDAAGTGSSGAGDGGTGTGRAAD